MRHDMVLPLILSVAAVYAGLRVQKRWEYREVRRTQAEIVERLEPQIELRERTSNLPSFEKRLASIPDVFSDKAFSRLRDQVLGASGGLRVRLPVHKSGATISYQRCHSAAPLAVAAYHSRALQHLVSDVVEREVYPTPLNDQSSCSILIYDRPGDHIGWHYDLNFYQGRHFTVLLPLVNETSTGGGLSSANLMVRVGNGDQIVPTPPNTLIVFEGASVYHKVTPLAESERRIILSMTFCTNPSSNPLKSTARRFKDIAYYGLRALWT